MKGRTVKAPVLSSLLATVAVYVLFVAAGALIPSDIGGATRILLDSAIRAVFAILCMILLRYILDFDVFKFSFTKRGFAKGMFACIAFFPLILVKILKFFFIVEFNFEYVSFVPPILLQQITTGLFEELWFRGLLMTAMLIRWGSTIKGRIAVTFISGVLFALAHMDSFIASGNIWTLLGPLFLGIGFAAIYTYSKNLMSCMLIHAVYDIAQHISGGLVSSARGEYYIINNIATNVLICGIIPIFAIILCVKAAPFLKAMLHEEREVKEMGS